MLAAASSVSVWVALHGTCSFKDLRSFKDLVAELAGHRGVLAVSAGAEHRDTAPDSE